MTLATNKSLPLLASSFAPSSRFTPEQTSSLFCANSRLILNLCQTSATLGKKFAKTSENLVFTVSQIGLTSLLNALFQRLVGANCAILTTPKRLAHIFLGFLKSNFLDTKQKFLVDECVKSFLSDYFLKGMQRYGLDRDCSTGAIL